jgi:hypothetical protein
MFSKTEKFAHYAVILAFILDAAALVWAWAALRGISTPLIVAFGPAGITEVGPLPQVLMVPLTGILFAIVDFFLLKRLPEQSGRRGAMAIISLSTALLLFMAVFAIIQANV